jgi:cobalt-zinc-cadmium efflux system outer membrane protein
MTRGIVWLGLLLLGLTGCASVDLSAGFPEVGAAVGERASTRIVWNQGTELDQEAAEQVRSLLRRKLTVDDALQVAMLNNRDLQTIYADLGLAQADLVQAGLFKNPVLDAAILFPLSGVRPDLQLSVVVNLLDALYVPLRNRVAAAQFEEAKLRVTGAVLDFTAQVRRAFYVHQANEQLVELRRTIVQALAASLAVSRRLHEAGNISDLDLARDRVQTETSKVMLRSAESEAQQSREQLNTMLGAWGEETGWEIDGRMPDIPTEPTQVNGVERVALARSIDLSHARQRILVAGQQLGYSRASALVPDVDLGASAEREAGEGWKVGPAVTVPLPLFDQGQARITRAASELRRAQQDHYALAVRVRSTARAVQDSIAAARDRVLYYRDILLPLRERIVNEGQLHYNAMQIGIAQLLRDREQQIETGVAYVEALRDYWLARADLSLIASGRLPTPIGSGIGGRSWQMKMKQTEGH